jgi:flavodoxin
MMQSDEPVEIRRLIRSGKIKLAGNMKLKIYGTVGCSSGKRMKKTSRVFFASAEEACASGFRPCGNCLRGRYLRWLGRS